MKPETRNILEKYKRLSSLASEMGIESDKSIDLDFLKEKLKNIKHNNKDEALNLIDKLLKIKK